MADTAEATITFDEFMGDKTPTENKDTKAKSSSKARLPVTKTAWTNEVKIAIEGGNKLCLFIAPDFALTDLEKDKLIKALIEEYDLSPELVKFFHKTSQILPHAQLAEAIAFIAMPRLLPFVMSLVRPKKKVETDEATATEGMETGRTSDDSRTNGTRQNNAGISPIVSTQENGSLSEQERQDILTRQDSENIGFAIVP